MVTHPVLNLRTVEIDPEEFCQEGIYKAIEQFDQYFNIYFVMKF